MSESKGVVVPVAPADGAVKSAEDAAEDELRESLMQPVCEGACPFMSMCCTCFLVGIVVPIVCLGVMGGHAEAATLRIAGVAGLALGFLLCCSGLYHLLLPKPPTPAPLFPVSKKIELVPPKKVIVLVNPKGGTLGASGLYDQHLKPKLDAAGIAYEKMETQYAGHGKVLCNTLPLDGIDAIIAIGGDGTFHECVNGMLDRKDGQKCAIGLIPGGSGNSFMTDFGLQKDPGQAADNIVAGRRAKVDALRVVYGPDDEKHHLWSINVVGYCADHCQGAINIDGWRGILGTARYDVCGLWGLLKGRTCDASVKMDGKPWESGVSAMFVNTTQHFGKGMRAAPGATLDDGKCDAAIIRGSRGHMLRLFSLIKTGEHAALMAHQQGSTVELVLPEEMGLFNVDGEVTVHHRRSVMMTVHPGAFDFYVSANPNPAQN